MKHTAQVIYTDFTEVFDIEVKGDNLSINLLEILASPKEDSKILRLDLSQNFKESYSVFPYKNRDLALIQVKNYYIVACYISNKIHWFKFDSNDLISYLLQNDITKSVLRYLGEDEALVLNSFLADLVRNDFSYSDLNKRVKFLKVALVMRFLNDQVKFDYDRIILDETFLGDIDLDQIALAFRFSNHSFLKLIKINNVAKIIALLERDKVLPKGFGFTESVYFLNSPAGQNSMKLFFSQSGVKFDYQIAPLKNYMFDFEDNSYLMNVGNTFKETVRGKLFVYNGDERDLMIN